MNSRQTLLSFGSLPHPIRFVRCAELLPPLLSLFHGWPIRTLDPKVSARPSIRVTYTPAGYRRVSCWQQTPSMARAKIRPTVVEAICGFHFEFIDAYLHANPKLIPLHGAGVQFGDKLVLFPAVAKSGKSTLSVHLAMAGHAVYSDDVMPIDSSTHQAVAMGIQPRIREVPSDAEDDFRAFVAARPGPSRPRRIYVSLRDGEIAPLDERAPVAGVVILRREDGATPAIETADPADVLETLILQNFSNTVPAPHVLEALHGVVAASSCYRLTFARAAQAAQLLEQTFGETATGERA